MGNRKIKILFFTPFAGFTGSEVVLFSFLRKLDLQKFDVRVFARDNGALLNTLPNEIPAKYHKKGTSPGQKLMTRLQEKISGVSSLEKQVMNLHNSFKPDIWYLNTLVLNDILSIAQKHNIPFAVHFHELLSQYKYLTAKEMEKLVQKASFAVGCCDSVCNNLKILGISKVERQYECFESTLIKVDNEKKQTLRRGLKIPEGHKIITMAGQRTERKGFDLFIDVAKELKDKPYYFLWLGAPQDNGYEAFLEKYIAHNKMDNIAVIYPPRQDYYNYLDLTDIFFLSSREDPFPLVMLEAAYLGKYIVALDSGGVKEFLKDSPGHIIDSLKIRDIANELEACCQKQISATEVAKSKESAMKFDVNRQTSLFEEILLNQCH